MGILYCYARFLNSGRNLAKKMHNLAYPITIESIDIYSVVIFYDSTPLIVGFILI